MMTGHGFMQLPVLALRREGLFICYWRIWRSTSPDTEVRRHRPAVRERLGGQGPCRRSSTDGGAGARFGLLWIVAAA